MAKRTKKVSINLTEDEYKIIEWLSRRERRSISEISYLILVDNAQQLFEEKQEDGEWCMPQFSPSPKPIKF